MKRLFWFIAQRYLSRAGQITSNHWRVYEDDLIGIPIKTFFLPMHTRRAGCVSEFIYTLIYSFVSSLFTLHVFYSLCAFASHFPISRTLNKILIIFLSFLLSLSHPLQILPRAIKNPERSSAIYEYLFLSHHTSLSNGEYTQGKLLTLNIICLLLWHTRTILFGRLWI